MKVCDLMPFGKENVANCIKEIGKYLIENADIMASDISKVTEIEIVSRICVDEFPSVDVNRHIKIPDTSVISNEQTRATTE